MAVIDLGDNDWPAQGSAEIVAAVAWAILSSVPALRAAGTAANAKGITGIEVFVDEVVVGAAVILVAARLHRHVNDRDSRLPVFGGVITGLVRYFLNRVRAGLGHLRIIVGPEDARGRILTVDAHRLGESRVAAQAV